MKFIIKENERGYLFKNGSFVKVLSSGMHSYLNIFGYNVTRVKLEGEVNTAGLDINVLMKDKGFAESISKINILDNKIALHYVDGRLSNILTSGEYTFWNVFKKHTFEVIDISKPEISKDIDINIFKYMPIKLYTKIEVQEGEVALLYFNSKFQGELRSGLHFFWNYNTKVSHQLVEMKSQQLDISGQEILTTDKVSLRINFVCNYRVTNAVKLIAEIKDYKNQIYILTQLALREYVGKYKFDELLEQKEIIGNLVLAKLIKKQAAYYIEFTEAGIKDIVLPGEIRDIMNTVLIAEKTAQANVISRREEVASTRSLLNTAKLMDENQTLFKLKELEYLERICDKVGTISVSGGNNLLKQLNELL
ncbi:MAG: slipin family protein [Clostridiaceae bacterium]|nr:slipin family protein [Clostridiaceae bacterium]